MSDQERPAVREQIEEMRARKDAAYEERNRVVAALSKLWPSHLAQHPEDDLTWERDWMTIVCIHSPQGQLTWHVHDSQRFLFAHLSMGEGHWDGHTTEQKYQRLAALQAHPPAVERIEQFHTGPLFSDAVRNAISHLELDPVIRALIVDNASSAVRYAVQDVLRQPPPPAAQKHAELLREALRKADEAIVSGQACRSEEEFARWMHDSQAARPHADLLSSSPTVSGGEPDPNRHQCSGCGNSRWSCRCAHPPAAAPPRCDCGGIPFHAKHCATRQANPAPEQCVLLTRGSARTCVEWIENAADHCEFCRQAHPPAAPDVCAAFRAGWATGFQECAEGATIDWKQETGDRPALETAALERWLFVNAVSQPRTLTPSPAVSVGERAQEQEKHS
jgi:hypothetical protein